MSEPVAWLRQRDNTLAVNDGGLFGSDWTPLYYAALAQPEQEPVGWLESPHGAFRANLLYKLEFPSQLLAWSVPLYAAPPQRKPLTDEEIYRTTVLMGFNPEWKTEIGMVHAIVRAIEKAHGIE
jgi:hypothetical protein